MRMNMIKLMASVMIAGLILTAAGCGKEQPSSSTKKISISELKQFDILIDWLAEPTYIGVYYANHLGLFKELGLDVTIVQGRGANQAAAAVASGRFKIATASGGATVLGRNNDMELVSLGVLYPNISTVVYGMASSDINSPEDLVGKKIGIYPGSITKNEFEAFVYANGFEMSDFEIVSLTGPDIPLLKNGSVDGVLNYAEMSPIALSLDADVEPMDGHRIYEIELSGHGVGGYGLNVITSRAAMNEDGEMLQKVANAIFEGYRRGCEEPEKAINAYLVEFPDKDPEYARKGLDRVCKLVSDNYGMQSLPGWDETIAVYRHLGLLETPVSASDLLP